MSNLHRIRVRFTFKMEQWYVDQSDHYYNDMDLYPPSTFILLYLQYVGISIVFSLLLGNRF